ncbi:ThuA domain-containing protein [uncultured Paludibaculum sp.]|uniref:ThuA domain-containing protein n=1 Tax=uncultured Paludibaculum sp. TaxID=1765020 RepID=UPI002AABA17A|nr:ThuA domain-containing protein [uncultured Paludibaculum sp.]
MPGLSRRELAISAFLAAPAAPLPVLIVDGMNNHDWQAGTRAIRGILESTGRFRVDVSTTPATAGDAKAWTQWRPEFARYAAVVNNFNGGHLANGVRWPAEVEQSLERYVSSGGGLVVFHAANNAFLEWTDYNEMIGLGWRDKSFGPGLILDDHEHVVVVPAGDGLGPGHGPRHDFEMAARDPRHPTTRDLPKRWVHPSEQLTHGQHGPAHPKHGALEKELLILTYALSKDSHRREPLDWVRKWNRGRIYTTMLGHTWKNEPNPNLLDPHFQSLLANGVEWAATGKVSRGHLPSWKG